MDSVSLRHAALSEAYAILSECGPGPVSLIISRHPNPKVSGHQFVLHRLIHSLSELITYTVKVKVKGQGLPLQALSRKSTSEPELPYFHVFPQVSEQEMDHIIARSTHRDKMSRNRHSSHSSGLKSLLYVFSATSFLLCNETVKGSSGQNRMFSCALGVCPGVTCKSPSTSIKERQGDGSPSLSWTMKRFLEPASRVRLPFYRGTRCNPNQSSQGWSHIVLSCNLTLDD